MSESHVPAASARDANDEKTMANSPGNTPGRKIEASNATLNKYKNSPIDAYYSFPSSNCQGVSNPYAERMDSVAGALGCKDTVKG